MAFMKQRARYLTLAATVVLVCSGLAISLSVFGSHTAHASGGGFNQPGKVQPLTVVDNSDFSAKSLTAR